MKTYNEYKKQNLINELNANDIIDKDTFNPFDNSGDAIRGGEKLADSRGTVAVITAYKERDGNIKYVICYPKSNGRRPMSYTVSSLPRDIF